MIAPRISVTHDAFGKPIGPEAHCNFSARHLMQEALALQQAKQELSLLRRITIQCVAEHPFRGRFRFGGRRRPILPAVGTSGERFRGTSAAIMAIHGGQLPDAFRIELQAIFTPVSWSSCKPPVPLNATTPASEVVSCSPEIGQWRKLRSEVC
jgi:hypothetical protein